MSGEENFPNFADLRETRKPWKGMQTPRSLAAFVEQAVYRSPDGQVRGLKYAYGKADGEFTTAQGDKFSVLENGEPGHIVHSAQVETHEALPILTETITLKDGTEIEVSTQPVSQLFEGKPHLGHPHFIQGRNSLEDGIVIPSLNTITITNSESSGNVRFSNSISTTILELHNPFINPLPEKTLQQLNDEWTDSFRTGMPVAETPDPTLVKTMTTEEYKAANTLRLVTKITPR